MSRIVLAGIGTPAFVPARHHAGPGLRCAHFARALSAAGHRVLLLSIEGGRSRVGRDSRPQDTSLAGVELLKVGEEDFSTAGQSHSLSSLLEEYGAEAMVAATAYASSLATRLQSELPFWADVFGDLMSEAQAKASVAGNDYALAHFWTLLNPVLARADRYSAVSRAQADALIGQLGLSGRLSSSTVGERLVEVITCAVEEGPLDGAGPAAAPGELNVEPLRGSVVPEDAFVVLWSGGFNTWCDIDTMFTGLESAMGREGRIHFVATGGAIKGHDEATYARFAAAVAGSRFRERFHLQGWIESVWLESYYRSADIGINIEKDVYERRFGSENRVVQWMRAGLPCISTGLSSLGSDLLQRGLAFASPCGDSEALARRLCELAANPHGVAGTGSACAEFAAREFSVVGTARPLCQWCERPHKSGDSGAGRVVSLGLLSAPGSVVTFLEAYLAQLSWGQLLYRSLRWIWRRLARGLRPDKLFAGVDESRRNE